jgi:CheY-like chemotaxis protein
MAPGSNSSWSRLEGLFRAASRQNLRRSHAKVLIAEDNAVNRELLRELLETGGYEVLEACDGQQALHIVEQTQPDILLLDIGMPVLDGFGVIRKIRENPCRATMPVLAVTAYAM